MTRGITFNECPDCGTKLYGLYVQVQRKGILHRINPYLRYCKECDTVYKICVVEAEINTSLDKCCPICGGEAYNMYGAMSANKKYKRYVTPHIYYCPVDDLVIKIVVK